MHVFHFFAVPLQSISRNRLRLLVISTCATIAVSRDRDVAQLVAHYVRDVGVGRSSRLIPTQKKGSGISATSFFYWNERCSLILPLPLQQQPQQRVLQLREPQLQEPQPSSCHHDGYA